MKEFDQHVFRYLKKQGKTIDGIAAELGKCILLGNYDWVKQVQHEHKAKDLMHLARIIKRKGTV